jgi:hypothetical protein
MSLNLQGWLIVVYTELADISKKQTCQYARNRALHLAHQMRQESSPNMAFDTAIQMTEDTSNQMRQEDCLTNRVLERNMAELGVENADRETKMDVAMSDMMDLVMSDTREMKEELEMCGLHVDKTSSPALVCAFHKEPLSFCFINYLAWSFLFSIPKV